MIIFKKVTIEFKKLSLIYSYLFIVSMYLISCGSNMDSASNVQSIFSSPLTLQDKMNVVCNQISSDSNLTLDGLGLGEELCSTDPEDTSNGGDIIRLSTLTENSDATSKSDEKKSADSDIYKFWTRTKFYIDNTLLEAAQKAAPTFSDLTTSSSSTNFHITMVNKLKLDEETNSATATFDVSSSLTENGRADISNRWALYGVKVENYIIASIETTGSTKGDQSPVESGKILFVMIPHAGDVYIDLLTQFNLNSRKVDSAMKKEIIKMLNQVLYKIKQNLA